MSKLNFMDDFNKEIDSIEGIGTSSKPPRYWYSTGNYVLNRIISGNFLNGIPQGRITNLAGPSGAGKSFIACNLLAAAQRQGAICIVIDTEGALDDDFVAKIGLDPTDENYFYYDVDTIPNVTKVVSKFLKGYKAEYGESTDAPQVVFLIDSLDMLMTETEQEHFDKGVTKGDQGQKNKQLKAMLRSFVQAIKHVNVAMLCTSQVYKNQDLNNGDGLWIVADAVKYAASQIVLIQKRKLKDDAKDAKVNDYAGVRMICEGYKTRFTKPFQKVEVEVPYESGMDTMSGLKEVAVKAGVLIPRGSRLQLIGSEETWFERDMQNWLPQILAALTKIDNPLGVDIKQEDIDTTTETTAETKERRKQKASGKKGQQAVES